MRAIFMGTGDIGLPSLRALLARPGCEVAAVVTQPDRPAGRGRKLRPPEVKRVAAVADVPVLQPARLRDPAAVAELAAIAPDVIVVMAYGQILPKAVLDLPRLACLNLHASLLPRHRGASPIQAALLAGDRQTGITVMHMAEGLDTGDILLSRPIDIAERETAGSLHDRLAELAAPAMMEALDLLERGEAPRTPQDESRATYAGRLTRESGRIDWSRAADEIDRHIRAMNPWPAASTEVPLADGGMGRLKVFDAPPAEGGGEPGEILAANNDGILVGTGSGAVLLREVQGEGGRRMAAGDWLRGHSVLVGGRCV